MNITKYVHPIGVVYLVDLINKSYQRVWIKFICGDTERVKKKL